MIRVLATLWGLTVFCLAQDTSSRIEALELQIKELSEKTQLQAATIQRLETLLTHDHRSAPISRQVLPADKILGTSIIFALMCAYTVFMDTGSIVLTFGTFASYLYTFYGFLKIVRNSATVAGNSSIITKATRD